MVIVHGYCIPNNIYIIWGYADAFKKYLELLALPGHFALCHLFCFFLDETSSFPLLLNSLRPFRSILGFQLRAGPASWASRVSISLVLFKVRQTPALRKKFLQLIYKSSVNYCLLYLVATKSIWALLVGHAGVFWPLPRISADRVHVSECFVHEEQVPLLFVVILRNWYLMIQ